MKLRALPVVIALVVVPAAAFAQTARKPAPKRTAEQIEASYQAHKADFDYLLGDWEFVAESKEFGKFRGVWSAVKLDQGQILDEYRVLGDGTDTIYATSTVRAYNKFADRWELIGSGGATGLQDSGTGYRKGDEVFIEQRFGVASGEPSTWKIRYFNIKPDSFSWAADRSTDGGKTWVRNHQTIEARRVGPSRSLGPLAAAKSSAAPEPAPAASAADPVSGTWKGQAIAGDNGNRQPLNVVLKFDGKTIAGTITGPRYPAEVTAGTFDLSTGALAFDAVVQDNGKTRARFEGTIDKGTATGRVLLGGAVAGTFTLTKSQ
jgi:hypothetical protein